MLLYKNERFNDFPSLHKKHNLIGQNVLMKKCNAGLKAIKRALLDLNIQGETITRLPSMSICIAYSPSDVQKVKDYLNIKYKNDVVPVNYISKKDLCELLGVKPHTLNAMQNYFADFKQYVKYFFVDNVKTKYYLATEETIEYYKKKTEIYLTPFSKRRQLDKPLYEEENEDKYQEYVEYYSHHNIRLDYNAFNKLLDTQSRYFKILLNIYKKYAKMQVNDSSIMDCHHIIPRFFTEYKHLEDMDNTIYLRRELHLLVHLLEYLCALPQYKNKFFSAFCILTMRIDPKTIDDNIFSPIVNGLIKALDVY